MKDVTTQNIYENFGDGPRILQVPYQEMMRNEDLQLNYKPVMGQPGLYQVQQNGTMLLAGYPESFAPVNQINP
jgi:hypothetical protein